jgi:aminotransferase
MRIIVPLQGVVQGRAGVFWGSLIPCALFYFLQLYIRQRRPSIPGSDPQDSALEEEEEEEEEEEKEENSGPDLTKAPQHPPPSEDSKDSKDSKDSPAPDAGPRPNLRRTSSSGSNLSRIGSYNDVGNYFGSSRSGSSFRSPRRPSFVSARAISVVGTGDSPYYIGWKEYSQNPFHSQENPHGVIQLGLAENKVWGFSEPASCAFLSSASCSDPLVFATMNPCLWSVFVRMALSSSSSSSSKVECFLLHELYVCMHAAHVVVVMIMSLC